MLTLTLVVTSLSTPQATSRRAVLLGGSACAGVPAAALARTPGSDDVGEAIQQIRDADAALRRLQREWSTYACIDKEGRACNIDAARKILGGVAPQRGDAAIAVAKETPLYRIDGAFAAVRKFALSADGDSWGGALDVTEFVERGEEVVFALKKVDDSFYGVVFASKGTTQLERLYAEAKQSVDRTVADLDFMLQMLREVQAPGL